MARSMRKKSIKDRGGMKKRQAIEKNANLGKLMATYRDVDEVLYPYVSSVGLVYEDMDFTIEEFADITGADVEELIDDITKAINKT